MDDKLNQRVQERLNNLRQNEQAFIARFDKNNDGVLDDQELQAAFATIRSEVFSEVSALENLVSNALVLESTILNRYRVISELGSGAQSTVYIARDLETDTLVVVKQMRIANLNTWDAFTSFQRESEVLSTLDHPCLPKIIELQKQDNKNGKSWISVQSFMEGENLEHQLLSDTFFTEEDLKNIANQCLDILTYIHENDPSVLHRDIKPSNLLRNLAGDVSLVDFGAVQYAELTNTMAMGTTGYMPGEQLLGRAVPQSDLFGLGMTLVRLATRVHPEDLDMNGMRFAWRSRASLSEGFSNWIDVLINPILEDRYVDARVAKQALSDPSQVPALVAPSLAALKGFQEIREGKPKGSAVRVWVSDTQFACSFASSFEKQKSKGFLDLVERFFSGSLSDHDSGGFSIEARGGNISFSITKENVLVHRFSPTSIQVVKNFDNSFSIVGKSALTSHAIASGLKREEADWIEAQRITFCDSKGLSVKKIPYKKY